MTNYPARRRDSLRQAVIEEGLDALLVSQPLNVTYLTGFTGESSYLVLARDRAVLVSDQRFTEQIMEECPGLDAAIRPPTRTIYQATADVIGKLGLHAVGFESFHLTIAELEFFGELCKTVSWKGGRDRVEQLRAVKDDSEVAAIREAIDVAARAFDAFRALLRPDDREKDLSDAMESFVRRCGGHCTSFPTIVAAGERAALPHAPPTDRAVGSAPMLLIDWGASGAMYKSDLTRVLVPRTTAPLTRPDARLEEVYDVVLRAQQTAIGRVRPGARGHEVDTAARSVIAEAGYGERFGHGLGHGIGLQVHEAPA
ncbi:MAG TPA: Xaa-Pro peptidase family protein, partial [Gemmataceae bacterium]|nr:Xaa-Pro peptidase family protein [Gemmataceae bacterium]